MPISASVYANLCMPIVATVRSAAEPPAGGGRWGGGETIAARPAREVLCQGTTLGLLRNRLSDTTVLGGSQ